MEQHEISKTLKSLQARPVLVLFYFTLRIQWCWEMIQGEENFALYIFTISLSNTCEYQWLLKSKGIKSIQRLEQLHGE